MYEWDGQRYMLFFANKCWNSSPRRVPRTVLNNVDFNIIINAKKNRPIHAEKILKWIFIEKNWARNKAYSVGLQTFYCFIVWDIDFVNSTFIVINYIAWDLHRKNPVKINEYSQNIGIKLNNKVRWCCEVLTIVVHIGPNELCI